MTNCLPPWDHVFIQLTKLISKNYYLNQSARDGFRSYIQSYASYSLKKIFNVNNLDLNKVGLAFGFTVPPAVNIPLSTLKNTDKKRIRSSDDHNGVTGVSTAQPDDEWEEDGEDEEDEDEQGPRKRPSVRRSSNSNRRKEQFGSKAVAKDHFRSTNLNTKDKQWSR